MNQKDRPVSIEKAPSYFARVVPVGQGDRISSVASKFLEYHDSIMKNCPDGASRDSALVRLEESFDLAKCSIVLLEGSW